MSEKNAFSTLRQQLMAWPGAPLVQRLEDRFSTGIPDTVVTWKGYTVWLEGKFMDKLPKRDTSKVKPSFQPMQVPWLLKCQRTGGRCFVWLRTPIGWYLTDEVEKLEAGIPLVDFRLSGDQYKTAKDMIGALRHGICVDSRFGRPAWSR
jgi:hypothetical protein